MIAEQVGIDQQTVWQIITKELRMQNICTKMVPKLLSNDQKVRRMQICEDTLQNIENDSELLTKVIMGDETWVLEYDLETKRQSKQWLSPSLLRLKKAHLSRSQKHQIDSLIQTHGCDRAAEDAVFIVNEIE